MTSLEDYSKYIELRKKLVKTSTSILTPNLGKGNHLHFTYLRISFIAKTIDYLVEMSKYSGINKIEGSIITEAVCSTSWLLNNIPSANSINLLLDEMADGLGLLEREDLGYIEVENPVYIIDKTKPTHIKEHLGFNYSLSEKGWASYQKQEFQILKFNLLSSNINRLVSYVAVLIAIISLISPLFLGPN